MPVRLQTETLDPPSAPSLLSPLDIVGVTGDRYLDLDARYYGQGDDGAYSDYREAWHLYRNAVDAYLDSSAR